MSSYLTSSEIRARPARDLVLAANADHPAPRTDGPPAVAGPSLSRRSAFPCANCSRSWDERAALRKKSVPATLSWKG